MFAEREVMMNGQLRRLERGAALGKICGELDKSTNRDAVLQLVH